MTSLVSDIFDLRPDETIAANMALETPQAVVRWRYDTSLPDIDLISLRRSTFRFPESLSDGDALLDEVPTSQGTLRSAYSDTAVEALNVYYYSLFFTHKGPYAMELNFSLDIQRLGILRGVMTNNRPDDYWVLAREEGGAPVIWNYNAYKQLVDVKIDLSGIVSERTERVVSIIKYTTTFTSRVFDIVTDKRYIQFSTGLTSSETVTTADAEFDFLGKLTPGFEIKGGTVIGSNIVVLDAENLEITELNPAGSVLSVMDISNLQLEGNFLGLSYDSANTSYLIGSGKIIYAISTSESSPVNFDIDSVYPVRQTLTADFHYDEAAQVVVLPDEDLDVLERYFLSDLSTVTQIEEPGVPKSTIVGLWKLNETSGAPIDYSGNVNTGVLVGTPIQGVTGKFSLAVQFDEVGDSIDLIAVGEDINFDNGFVKFWYKSPYDGYTVSSSHKLLFVEVNASNFLQLELTTARNFLVTMTRSGSSNTISTSAATYLDDGLFHAFEIRWTGGVGGTLEFFIDSTSVGSTTIVGSWVGIPSVVRLGGDSSDSALGCYDDVIIGAGVFTSFTRYQLITRGNRAHALSGRDYSETGQHWRDALKFEFGEYILRNDFREITLPQDKSLDDEEVIFRETAEDLTLGELSRLARMFGLFLDRNTDRRKFFMNHLTARSVEFEFIDEIGELINASDLDPAWNVEVQRRHLEVMYYSFQRSGTLDAFKRLTRHLGFRLLCPDDVVGTLLKIPRRFFDSVVDASRPDVPFDTSFFDSGGDSIQLVTLVLKFYIQNYSSTAGATSVPASRQLNDAGADFLLDAEVGSMIIINDPDSDGDDGQYLITAVNSATQVVVDRDWPVGSLSSLDYRLHWRIPVPDPYNDQILARLEKIKVRWQQLEVTA